MSDIRVFVASSFDCSEQRAVIGDCIRELNDRYEIQGHRIHLCCWEDFMPEFTGTRKQTEYNEQLIMKSQLFVALFKERCGDYTKEEIREWQNKGESPLVLVIEDPSIDKTAINKYLSEANLDSKKVETDEEIRKQLTMLVENYLTAVPPSTPSSADIRYISRTIPTDMSSERMPFSNLVRSIDDLADQFFHLRCRLVDDIPASHYYVAILKDHVNDIEESEILTAIQTCTSKHSPSLALYYNHFDRISSNHPAISQAIKDNGLFNEPYAGLTRVKYNLLRWLIQQSTLRLDLTVGIDVREGWFYFSGMPIIQLSQLGINEAQTALQMAELIKRLSFEVLGANETPENLVDDDIDIAALDSQLAINNSILETTHTVEQVALAKQEELLQVMMVGIDALLSHGVTSENIVKLTELIRRKEQLQTQLHKKPMDILRTQMLLVQLHDTFPDAFATTSIDIDYQYKIITDTADSYGVLDPTVEMMRMNYANYLHRQNRNSEALKLYDMAMTRLDSMDERSELIRGYVIHAFVSYANHLTSLGLIERSLAVIDKLDRKTIHWQEYGINRTEHLSNRCRVLACYLRIRPVLRNIPRIVDEAMTTYNEATHYAPETYDSSIRDEVFCDLPICMASTLIDSLHLLSIPLDKLCVIADDLLQQVIDYADQHLDVPKSNHYLGNAYHNRAFLYANILHDQLTARKYCIDALTVRKDIHQQTHFDSCLYDVAQTLLLLGATFINDRHGTLSQEDYDVAINYANECLEIYSNLDIEHFPEQETYVHQAIQLKGSIHYFAGHRERGLALLRQAWDWNLKHPENSYREVFEGVAGEILKHEGWI